MSNARTAIPRHFYIKDLITGEYCRCMAVMESSTEGKTVAWATQTPIGRSAPIYGYPGSGAGTCSYAIALHSSAEQEDTTTPEDVKKWCEFCLSLTYPDYGGGIKPPHKVLVHFGNITFTAVVTSVSIQYLSPFDVRTGLAYHAKATLGFSEVNDVPKDYKEIRGGRS